MRERKINFGLKAAYGIGDFGMNLFSMAVGSFITIYYTDNVFLSVAFVGTMMLITRFLDGISDIIMGILIDRTKTRFGKSRPWVIGSTIPLGLSMILLFTVPSGLSVQGKEIYAYVTYIFSMVICGTAANLSYSTLCTLMSDSPNERTELAGARAFCSNVGSLVATTFTLSVITGFGGGQKGFTGMAVLYAVVVMICLFITGIRCKEYNVGEIPEVIEKQKEEKNSIMYSVKLLFRNKYAWAVTGCFIFNWFAIAVNSGTMVYYARDVLHNAGYVSALALSISLPAIIILAVGVVPRLTKRYGKRSQLVFGSLLQIVGFVMAFFCAENFAAVLIGMTVRTFGLGIFVTNLFACVADVADYINIKNNVSIAGVTNSITSFGMKVGLGLGSAALGWILAFGGYSGELAANGMEQSAQTILAEKMCYAGVPAICCILVTILALIIDVDKKLETIQRGVKENV